MPFREEMGIIWGFDQILTEFAIFRTRKVHPPVQWHQAVHTGTKHEVRVQVKHRAREVGQTSTWVFLHSMAAAQCPWYGMQKLLMSTEEDDMTDCWWLVSPVTDIA